MINFAKRLQRNFDFYQEKIFIGKKGCLYRGFSLEINLYS